MQKHRVEVIDRTYAAVLAAKTPAERIAMMDAMHRHARQLLACRVAELLPDAPPEKQHHEYLRRLLGNGTIAALKTRG